MTLSLTTAPADMLRAAQLLAAGRLVAFPTETVYGLGADATSPEAVAGIYAAKGRPAFNPLIAHVADLAAALREGVFDAAALALAEAFWPGPLTLVVPVRAGGTVCELARAGLTSVGLRVPAHPLAEALLRAVGKPVAAPSANRSGHVSPTSAAHVLQDLDGRIDAVLDGGAARVGIESTIVGCLDGAAHLLRPGSITRADLEQALGAPLAAGHDYDGDAPRSPGRLASHYAPATPLRLEALDVRPGEAALNFGPVSLPGTDAARASLNLSERADTREAAASLYRCLRELDAVGATAIAVAALPKSGLGEALRDRLMRAATK